MVMGEQQMTTYARIVDGHAVDVTTTDPKTIFHEDVASGFVEVPDDTGTGDHFDGTTWTKYAAPVVTPPAPSPPAVTPPQFKLLILPELAEIITQAKTDVNISAFLEIINDPRLTEVDMSLMSVQNGLKYCLTQIGRTDSEIAARMQSILSGVWS